MLPLKIIGGVVGAAGAAVFVTSWVTLSQRVEQLEREVQQLSVDAVAPDQGRRLRMDRRRARQDQRRGSLSMPPFVSPAGAPPIGRDPGSDGGEALSDDMQDQVRGLVREEQARQEQERQEQFRSMFVERIDGELEAFAREYEVTTEQQEELSGLMYEELERSFDLRAEVRSGERSRAEVREDIRAVRAETSARAKEILSASQLEGFESFHQRRGGGWRGGPPRR